MGLHPFPPQHCRQSSIPVAARAVQTPWRPAEVVRARVRVRVRVSVTLRPAEVAAISPREPDGERVRMK